MLKRTRFETELSAAVRPRSWHTLVHDTGTSQYSLRTAAWRQVARGFYVPGDVERDATPTQRIVEAVPLIPAEGALTGWAAAFVSGVDELDGWDPWSGATQRVPLVRGADRGHVPRDWIISSRDRLDPDEVTLIHGIRVTTPLRAAFDVMRMSRGVADAVSAADAMLHAGIITADPLRAYVAAHAGWRGVPRARAAATLVDAATRSPWESRLRVFYMTVVRLPAPLVNAPVFSRSGELLGIADLLDPVAGLVTEFDGRQHREREQHRADNVREERLESAGLIVVRADSLDLRRHREQLAGRLRGAWRRGMARDRSKDGWIVGPST